MTANVSVSNTTSLYQGSGPVNVLTSTQALYNIFSNSGNVQFSLIDANTRISANAINLNNTGVSAGTYGGDTVIPVFTVQADGRITGVVNTPISGALGSYGNSNVAAYLPTYTGSLDNSSSVINLWSNAVSQQTQINTLLSNAATQSGEITTLFTNAATQATAINTLNANLGAFETYANATFTVSSYGNANVAAYLPTDPTIIALQSNAGSQQTSINTLFSNAATQAGQIAVLDANLGTATTNVTALFSNAAAQATAIDTLNANVGAFETYANLTFGPSSPASYGNANVAAYLPTYTGSLENSSSIINLWANAASQQTQILNIVATGNANARAALSVTSNSGTYSDSSLTYNNTTGVFTYNEPTSVRNAQNVRVDIKNTSGASLTKGTPVYVTGTVGVTDVYEVSPSRADTPSTMPAAVLLDQDLAPNAQGHGTSVGLLSSVNTNSYTANQVLYVGVTGGLTATRPNDGYVVQPIGSVGRVNSSTGSIFVNIWNINSLPNLGQGNIWYGQTGGGIPVERVLASVALTGSYYDLTNGNAGVASYLPTYSGNLDSVNNLTVSGRLFSDDITAAGVRVDGDATITGNLFVEGNVTTINSNVITTNDLNITVGNNISSASLLTGAGLIAGNPDVATWLYDYSTNSWQSNINILSTNATQNLGSALVPWNNVYATTLHGDASQVTGLANNSTIQAIDANLGTATTNINTLFSNAASQQTQIDTATSNISTLFSNAASQQTQIDGIDANLGTATTNITTLFSNAATQAGQIDTLNANIGAFETYANAALANVSFNGNLQGNPLYDSTTGRAFSNAYPFSSPDSTTGGTANGTTNWTATPVYTAGVLQPATTPVSQTVGFTTVGNVALRSQYSASNRNTNFTTMYGQVTPVTANIMLNQDRVRAHQHVMDVMAAGKTWGTMSVSSVNATSLAATNNVLNYIGTGEASNLTGTLSIIQQVPWGGRANVQYATAYSGSVLPTLVAGSNASASNIAYARLINGTINPTANLTVTNAVGLHTHATWAGSSTNKYVILNEDGPSIIQTAGNITMGNASSYLSVAGDSNLIGNTLFGSPGKTANFSGNVNYNSAPPYVTTFYGNVVQGVVGSYTQLRGTTLVQGNIKFDSPYYETVNAMGNQSGTLVINTGICNTFTMTLTGDITINTTSFTNMIAGKSITLILTQDGTGGRTLTSNLLYAGGNKTLTTDPGSIDIINMYYDGSRYLASMVNGYA